MLRILGAAVAAVVFSLASAASAATLVWSGVVGEYDRGGDYLSLSNVAGLYTFVSDARIVEYRDVSVEVLQDYHLHSEGIVQRGYRGYRMTWDEFGMAPPAIIPTSTGFAVYVDPPQDRHLRTDLEVCDEWFGCGYDEYWIRKINFWMLLRFEPGSEGKAMALYFEPGPPQSAIPEPATWAMMIVGFGLTGVVMRRRRSALA